MRRFPLFVFTVVIIVSYVFYLIPDSYDNNHYNQIASLIHGEQRKLWGIDTESLYELAKENTPGLLPVSLENMDDILMRVAESHLADDYSKDLIKHFMYFRRRNPLYVLSNTKGMYGAAAILYDGVLRDFAEKLEKDLLILSSSIHETLLIACAENIIPGDMAEMVKYINRAEVLPKDVLSDHVYRYSRETGTVSIAS